jgi:hypothetical protein
LCFIWKIKEKIRSYEHLCGREKTEMPTTSGREKTEMPTIPDFLKPKPQSKSLDYHWNSPPHSTKLQKKLQIKKQSRNLVSTKE